MMNEYSSYIVEFSVTTVMETDFDDKMPLRQMLPCSDSLCSSDISSRAHARTSRDEFRIWRLIQSSFLYFYFFFHTSFSPLTLFPCCCLSTKKITSTHEITTSRVLSSHFPLFSHFFLLWALEVKSPTFLPCKPPSMSWFSAINCFLVTPLACLCYGLIRGCPLCHSLKMIWTVSLFCSHSW